MNALDLPDKKRRPVMQMFRHVTRLVSFGMIMAVLLLCGCDRFFEQRKHRYYNQGMRFYEKGNYNQALREFAMAREFDKNYFDALYMGGMCLYQKGRYDSAIDWFTLASDSRPDDLELRIKIIECHFKIGKRANYRRATLITTPLLDSIKNDIRIKFYHAKACIRTRQEEYIIKGLEALEELKQLDTTDYPVACLVGELHAYRQEFEAAEEVLFGYEKVDDDWISSIYYLAQQYQELEIKDEQISVYERVVERVEGEDMKNRFRLELVALLRQYGRAEKEEKVLLYLVNAFPDQPAVRMDLLKFYKRQKRVPEAAKMLAREMELKPDNLKLKRMMIELYADAGKLKKALEKVEQFIAEAVPGSEEYVTMQNIKAGMQIKLGEYDEAEKISNAILRLNPEDPEARFNICKIIILRESASLSVLGELRLLVRDNSENPDFFYYLGLLHESMQENNLAERYYVQALELDPTHREALLKLSEKFLTERLKNELEPFVERYLELVPEDVDVLEILKKIQSYDF